MTSATSILDTPLSGPAAPTLSDLALDLHSVSKIYSGPFGSKKVHALRDIDMRVHRGEIFGLLGPNGAGKSTLVKILMTVIRPTTCRGLMLGRTVGDKHALRRVGYLPEHHRFPDYLTASQLLDYFGALSDVPRATRRRKSAELLELVGISAWANHKVKGFSKGMRQRLGIANALMMDPELVVLDEPTDGVDPVGRRDIRQILTTLRDQGRTVFLNSHLLSELEMVCTRVAILVQGRVSAQGTIDELTRDSRRYEIEVSPPTGMAEQTPAHTFLPAALSHVSRMEPVSEISAPPMAAPRNGNGAGQIVAPASMLIRGTTNAGIPISIDRSGIRVSTDDPAAVQPLIDALRAAGITIRAVRPVRESLEDLFMKAVTDPETGRVRSVGASSEPSDSNTPRANP
jgi:ABC-2 type transport system ATP-binding protein